MATTSASAMPRIVIPRMEAGEYLPRILLKSFSGGVVFDVMFKVGQCSVSVIPRQEAGSFIVIVSFIGYKRGTTCYKTETSGIGYHFFERVLPLQVDLVGC